MVQNLCPLTIAYSFASDSQCQKWCHLSCLVQMKGQNLRSSVDNQPIYGTCSIMLKYLYMESKDISQFAFYCIGYNLPVNVGSIGQNRTGVMRFQIKCNILIYNAWNFFSDLIVKSLPLPQFSSLPFWTWVSVFEFWSRSLVYLFVVPPHCQILFLYLLKISTIKSKLNWLENL